MGRPQKKIDPSQVQALAAIGCTVAEIAATLDCSKDTLERRFAAFIEKGRERMKMSLRRHQIKAAEKGNATMLIWLGKQYLGQRDRVDVDVKDARARAEAAIEGMIRDAKITRAEAIERLSQRIDGFADLVSSAIQ
jgi:hypothetical protein